MTAPQRPRGRLCLTDGSCFEGELFGAVGHTAVGEVVFTTGMTGYQEVLSDPSYTGQIVTMTAPQIGNTGVNTTDPESGGRPTAAGFVVRELSSVVSSWRAQGSLEDWLLEAGVLGISGVDTRRLTRHLRDGGSQNGAIGAGSVEELVEAARAAPNMEGLDLAARVSTATPYTFDVETPAEHRILHASSAERPKVVVMDLGIKHSILRNLVDSGCRVQVVPATATAAEIRAHDPDGVFVSNGPGDPAVVDYAITTLRDLLGKQPIFGICLGHQLLSLAVGARTYKLKFGHRGLNQPVMDLKSGRVEITSQNHGFAVDVASLPTEARASYVHLNDNTSEGIEVPDARAFSVQFHPEAAAGPHDTLHLFHRFRDMMLEPRRA